MKQPLFILCTLASALCVTGCTVGPRYRRPAANTPQVFRATPPDINPTPITTSLGDEKWAEVFRDPILQQLIREAGGESSQS